jgi:hypothetical protein
LLFLFFCKSRRGCAAAAAVGRARAREWGSLSRHRWQRAMTARPMIARPVRHALVYWPRPGGRRQVDEMATTLRTRRVLPCAAALILLLLPRNSPPSPKRSYQASRDDLAVYAALASKPDAGKYANAARWYSHISALLGAR